VRRWALGEARISAASGTEAAMGAAGGKERVAAGLEQ
jgi:hypothetical protein